MTYDPFALMTLIGFIVERERIRRKKEEEKLPPPWTSDPVLSQFRFCNVHRENDKVSRWLFNNWMMPNHTDPDVWFAAAVGRHVNLPATLQSMGYPVPWDPEAFIYAIRARKELKIPAYNAAYMIRAARGESFPDKAAYLAYAVFEPMWKYRETTRPRKGDTLKEFNQRLLQQYGIAGFMSGQIIADTKHVGVLREASDWWTFAVSGPGSRRGLNRLLGRDKNARWKEEEWHEQLLALLSLVMAEVESTVEEIDAQNFQNCLCECDKMLRYVLKEGRPKQRYVAMPEGLFDL